MPDPRKRVKRVVVHFFSSFEKSSFEKERKSDKKKATAMLVGQQGVKFGLSLPSRGDDDDGGDERDRRKPAAPPSSNQLAAAFGADDDDDDVEEDQQASAKASLQRDIARQASKKAADAKV